MVSVFLLSWNHEKYIRQAVISIIEQTYKNIEVVYVDNNSTDNTYEVAKQLLQGSGLKFQAFKRDNNYGIAANFNFGLAHCSGTYFSPLSADDWIEKDNILEKIKAFEHDPSVGLVYSGGYKYYEEFDIVEPLKVIVHPDGSVLEELLKQNFITGVGCLIKKSVLEDVGQWNESYNIEDGDMWVRIVSKYKIIGIDKYLFYYRQHTGSFSYDPEKMLTAKMEWLETNKHLNKNPGITYRYNIDNYLSKKVLQETSWKVIGKVLRHFRVNRLYFTLLIKSFLPVKWKRRMHKRSLVRKLVSNKHV